MSFWQLSDGTQAENTTTFESGGGNFDPIPDNTQCIAAIEEAKWSDWEGESYINLKWRVMRPNEYGNRVIFQKLHVMKHGDKGDKAKRMLMAIDANCGGKLAKLRDTPQDEDLMMSLVGKPVAIKVQVWDMNGKKGNWISAVAPAKQQAPQAPQQPTPRQPAPIAPQTRQSLAQASHNQQKSNGYQPQNSVIDDDDSDIPF